MDRGALPLLWSMENRGLYSRGIQPMIMTNMNKYIRCVLTEKTPRISTQAQKVSNSAIMATMMNTVIILISIIGNMAADHAQYAVSASPTI